MRTRYIGKKPLYRGKFLLGILANLRDFGIGRMVARSHYLDRYPEPCYHIIKKVEPLLSADMNKGTVWAETYHRGHRIGIEKLSDIGYSYWLLVPKAEESAFLQVNQQLLAKVRPRAVVPAFVDFPPLLEQIIKDDEEVGLESVVQTDAEGKLRLPVKVDRGPTKILQQEGVEVPMGSYDPTKHNTTLETTTEQMVKHSLLDPKKKKPTSAR